jgi:hypothetical protein
LMKMKAKILKNGVIIKTPSMNPPWFPFFLVYCVEATGFFLLVASLTIRFVTGDLAVTIHFHGSWLKRRKLFSWFLWFDWSLIWSITYLIKHSDLINHLFFWSLI